MKLHDYYYSETSAMTKIFVILKKKMMYQIEMY